MYDNEKAIKEYIRQCWAEAVHLYKDGKLQAFARKEVLDQIREAQEAAMEDDWRIGAIEQYLEDQKKAASPSWPNDELPKQKPAGMALKPVALLVWTSLPASHPPGGPGAHQEVDAKDLAI